ncbi:MAG: aspartate carbamoyltransferase catalytic subunit, partial [Pseudomonadota bacterium]
EALADGLHDADVAMGLRMQYERMESNVVGDSNAYFAEFGLTRDTLKLAKPGAKVMHPGPMNRGVEIDGALADDPERSLILQQVFFGVPTRMALLDALVNQR